MAEYRRVARNCFWVALLFAFFSSVLLSSGPSHYQGRAFPSIAKIQLAAIHTGESAVFKSQGSYTHDLEKLDVLSAFAAKDVKWGYVIGFNPGCGQKGELAYTLQLRTRLEFREQTARMLPEIEKRFHTFPCENLKKEFLAYAVGSLDGDHLNIWTISDQKVVTEIEPGTTLLRELQAMKPGELFQYCYLRLLLIVIAGAHIWILRRPYRARTRLRILVTGWIGLVLGATAALAIPYLAASFSL